MNNATKITIALAAVGTIAVVGAAFSVLSSENELFERFPNIDPKIVVKAHRRMLLQTLTGKYINADLDDEAILDEIFLDNVYEIEKKNR